MHLPIYQVDAFADAVFSGNPAAVVPLESWLPDSVLQAIAAENNLSETAFFVPAGEGWELRWFTPTVEMDLCGHATLATAFVLATILTPGRDRFLFQSREAGALAVTREGDRFTLDFPVRPPRETPADEAVLAALGIDRAVATLAARDYLVVLEAEEQVRALRPDMGRLAATAWSSVIVTAPGAEVDFVSRLFAPAEGLPEDPVTGSAHCTLTPYWAGRLNRTEFKARQVSPRGGNLHCRLMGERVLISGTAVLYLEGTIHV